MRRFVYSGLLLAVVSAAIAFAGLDVASGSHAGGMQAMSIDMDTSGNTATSLGPPDSCRSVTPATTFDIDVTALDIPATSFGGMSAFTFVLHYNSTSGAQTVTANDPSFLLFANPGGNLFLVSDIPPDSDGSFFTGPSDISGLPGETGSGVLSRNTMSVGAAAAPGLYQLTLTDAAHVDEGGFANIPDTINNAYLVVGGSCDDLDGDGIPNAGDACPTISGPASNAGCPPPGPPAVGGVMGLLEEAVPAPDSAADSSASFATIALQAVAGLLILLGTVALVRRRIAR